MDESEFEMLFGILKILQKEDLKGSSISMAVTSLIDNFNGQMSAEQRLLVGKEFIKYRRKRAEMPEHRHTEGYF